MLANSENYIDEDDYREEYQINDMWRDKILVANAYLINKQSHHRIQIGFQPQRHQFYHWNSYYCSLSPSQ